MGTLLGDIISSEGSGDEREVITHLYFQSLRCSLIRSDHDTPEPRDVSFNGNTINCIYVVSVDTIPTGTPGL